MKLRESMLRTLNWSGGENGVIMFELNKIYKASGA